MITSINNEQIKKVSSLKQSKYRKLLNMFLVEGEHLIEEAKKAGVLLECYTTKEELEGELISEAVMKKICNTVNPITQIGVCKYIKKEEICKRVLIVDKIQDPGNLGTLLRSAVSFNFNTIFLAEGTCDVYNDKVIRSSQGAIFKLNIIHGNIVEFITALKKTHKVYGTSVLDGIDAKHIDHHLRNAVVLGNEGSGISQEVLDLNLDNIYIAMHDMQSLNVSVAGSIIMYELSK